MTDRKDALPEAWVRRFGERFLHGNVDDTLREKLKVLGLQLDSPATLTPYAVWAPAMEVLATHWFPDRPLDDALQALGRRLVELGVHRGSIASGWLLTARLLGPFRLLELAKRALRPDRFYLAFEAKKESSKSLQLSVNEPRLAALVAGFWEGVLLVLGKDSPQVTVNTRSDAQAVLLSHWQ